MDFKPHDTVSITLEKSTCLVLFELLANSYQQWRKDNPKDSAAAPMSVCATEHGQRVALWRLESAIERTLPEIFAGDYSKLVEESMQYLSTTG